MTIFEMVNPTFLYTLNKLNSKCVLVFFYFSIREVNIFNTSQMPQDRGFMGPTFYVHLALYDLNAFCDVLRI